MRNVIATVATIIVLSACSSAFKVQQADTRFSESKNQIYLSENNRISTKSIAGGIHIDSSGVYLNPFVEKTPENGEIVLLGLNITNKTSYDTMFGAPNQLGVLEEVIFKLDGGDLITLPILNHASQTSDTIAYNSITRSASYAKWETGTVVMTPVQFGRIASAKALSCKIIGSKKSVIYEESNVSPTFTQNLNNFFTTYVRGQD
ncbi:hypothetical protein [Trichloromonas sp.]|uniref:hypothetical protein n=1 Tax=Trichloromonas sp. TaxID=3069249 RepID=UPI002A4C1AD5|nr:hypothetical protein [Trichloromonas sp.]